MFRKTNNVAMQKARATWVAGGLGLWGYSAVSPSSIDSPSTMIQWDGPLPPVKVATMLTDISIQAQLRTAATSTRDADSGESDKGR
jgi:hypothetical protein